MPQSLNEDDLVYSTPMGKAVLESPSIHEVLCTYYRSETPERINIPGVKKIGEGKFSTAFVCEGVVLKISSPTSGYEAAKANQPSPVENLGVQFVTLSSLGEYIQGNPEGVSVPEQFFALRTPHGAFVLGQQFMEGWVTFEQRTLEEYGSPDAVSRMAKAEIGELSIDLAYRIQRAVRGFPLRRNVNDLVWLDEKTNVLEMHGGNILVPAGSTLRFQPPVCIIDQPDPYWNE